MGIKENPKLLYGSLLSLFLISFAFAFVLYSNPSSGDTSSGISYKGTVCVDVDRADGSHEDIGCKSNLLTNAGADAIKDYIGTGGGTAFDYIALCNATAGCGAAALGSTTMENEYASAGLERVQGTYGSLSNSGNWSIYTTFTATEDSIETNKTGLFNSSSADTLLAENTFTLVTLQTSDQLTINWTITASDGG